MKANRITDSYGRLWPKHYDLCSECRQPDNCGDCNHGRLKSDEVLYLGGYLAENEKVDTDEG